MFEIRIGDVVVPEQELIERFSRSSGPGGQYVNTSDTRVELRWDVGASAVLPERLRELLLERLSDRLSDGALVVTASEFRSQLRNRVTARRKMASVLASAAAPAPPHRRSTKPSRAVREARLTAKRRRAELKRLRRRPKLDGREE